MSVETNVRAKLLTVTAVTDLVSTRITVHSFRQAGTWPAIRIVLIGETEFYSHDGTTDIFRSRVQVDCADRVASGDDPYAAAAAVADAVNAALSGFKGPVGSPAFTFTGIFKTNRLSRFDAEERELITVTLEYDVWHRV